MVTFLAICFMKSSPSVGEHAAKAAEAALRMREALRRLNETGALGLPQGQQVRIGQPLRVKGLPQAATGAAFASSVGLCLFAAHPQDEWWDFEMPIDRYPARSLKRAVKWFRDNW